MTSLQNWNSLWSDLGCDSSERVIAEAYHDLVKLWGRPERAYHNLSHLQFCLEQLDQASGVTDYYAETGIALWFHDAIYDVHAKDNEEVSALYAISVMSGTSLAVEKIELIAELIRVTTHAAEVVDRPFDLMVDIDLAILGSGEDEYLVYQEAIRKEYDHVRDDDFVAGRSAVLRSFLKRGYIYHTVYFREKYEARASKNLEMALGLLVR